MNNEIKPGMMKYCVIGNIIDEHIDEKGIVRHGTKCFPGGRKVYITRRLWEDGVLVMGLNRYKSKYVYENVPLTCLENIRFSKAFKPRILEEMRYTDEFPDEWWMYKEEDRIGAMEYAELLNRIKDGDSEAFEKYKYDVMSYYY